MQEIFLLLILLQVKHWFVDFINQTQDEVNTKGVYGHPVGLNHSIKHGIATAICIIIAYGTPYISIAFLFALLDTILHYHIDFCKMRFGNRDINTHAFWAQLGLDQMAHQLTYLGIAYALI